MYELTLVYAVTTADVHVLARFPLSLHLTLAEDTTSVPPRQPGLGVPEIRAMSMELRSEGSESFGGSGSIR